VPLPPELKITHIREAVEHIESKADELIDIYFEQANVFSGIIGILGTQALDALSPYKKHKHPDVAQQRFPGPFVARETRPTSATRTGIQGIDTPMGAAIALQSPGMVRCLALRSRPN
jgi:hypothetical protein